MCEQSCYKYVVVVDPFSTSTVLARKLQERGYRAISLISKAKIPDVFSGSYRREDFDFEIRFEDNLASIVHVLSKFDVRAVIPSLEISIAIADQLNEALNLQGNACATSELRRDKYLMSEALRQAQLRAVKQEIVHDTEMLNRWIAAHGRYPVVLKPVRSAGSDSVFICSDNNEVQLAFQNIINRTNKLEEDNTAVLVQEFLDGNEYVVDTVSLAGVPVTTNVFVYEKIHANGSDCVYRSIRTVDMNSPVAKQLIDYNNRVLHAVGIEQGAGHSEIIITDGEPCLVEVGARLHGGNIPSIVNKCAAWSQIDLLLDAYIDKEAFRIKMQQGLMLDKNILIHFYVSFQEGTIHAINNQDKISELDSYYYALWYKSENDKLEKTIDLYSCPLKVILINKDEDILLDDRNKLVKLKANNDVFITSN